MNTSDPLKELARRRAGGMRSLEIGWEQALKALPALPAEATVLLATHLPDPKAVRQVARVLSRSDEPAAAWQTFVEETEDSDETIGAWITSLAVLTASLEGTRHRPTLDKLTGYLHCCAAVVDTGPRYTTLPGTVETMLETYGYSGDAGE